MIFKIMKKEDALAILSGSENILTKEAEEQKSYFRRLTCPSCEGEILPILNVKKLFNEGGLLPNTLAKCKACDLEFEPYTKIIVSLPKSS